MIDDLKINDELKGRWYAEGYWTPDTIADIWQRAAVAHPDREYVCDDTGSRLTYGEVDDKSGHDHRSQDQRGEEERVLREGVLDARNHP